MTAVLGVTPSNVQEAACNLWGIKWMKLLSRDRTLPIREYRHVAMYVTRKMCELSYPKLAKAFNRMDHTTAMNAVRRVEGDARLMVLAGVLEEKVGTGGEIS